MLKRYIVTSNINVTYAVKCKRMEVEGGALIFYRNVEVRGGSIQEIVSYSIKDWVEVKFDGVESVD